MKPRTRITALCATLAMVAAAAAGISIWFLYDAGFSEQRARLVELAKSQARLIEAIAGHEGNEDRHKDDPADVMADTLALVTGAHATFKGFGETGEFTLARRRGGEIVFLLSHRHADLDTPKPVPFESPLAEPMRRALSGQSGTVIGLDYRGAMVLAAHEPVSRLNAGIVAKIDLAEIRAPFLKAGGFAVAAALFLMLLGTYLVRRIAFPMVGELRRSEERFRALFHSASLDIHIRDRQGRYVLVNKAYAKQRGRSLDEIKGKTPFDFFPEDLAKAFIDHDREVLETGRVIEREIELPAQSGDPRRVIVTKFPIFGADGTPEAIGAINTDITERKRAEDALKESEERFRSVIDNSPSFITLKDADGRFQLINRKHVDMFGLEPPDVVGKISHHFLPEKQATEAVDHDRKVIETKSATTEERQLATRQGTRDFLVTKFPVLDGSGDVMRIGTIGTDITERKRTEERLRGAVESLQEGFALFDADDRLVAINDGFRRVSPAAEEMMERGGSFEDVLRANVAEGTIVDAIGREEEFIRERMEQHRDPKGLIIRRFIDGRWYLLREARTPEGGTALSLIDITELKQAEEAMRESEMRFRTIFQRSGDAILLIDAEDGRIGDANDEASSMLGYSRDELLGITIEAIHPHDFEQASKFLERVKRHGKDTTEELSCRTKSGNNIPAEVSATPVVIAGTPSILVNIRDITERKKAEAALKTSQARLAGILDIAPEAVIAIDADMIIRLFNQGAERVFGYSAGDMLGRPLDALMPERFRRGHDKHVQTFDRSGDAYRLMGEREEIVGLRKDGTEFPASATVGKLEIGDEKIFTVLLRDITEQKQAEDALLAAKKEAERASHTKSEFLTAMSHELRTPLNAILGFADILSRQYFGPLGGEKYLEYARDIHSSGEHLLELVNDLLDLSTIEAGKQSLVREKLPIGEIIQECAKIVGDKARSYGVDLITKAPKNLPPLYADRRATKQILLNLLSNAVKFTPEGGKVTLSAKASKGKIVFKVADTGKGIPPEKLPGLTDPFTKVEGDPYLSERGWGLGLSITKSLIDLHDGQLDIKSKVGRGTTVTVTLPNDEA